MNYLFSDIVQLITHLNVICHKPNSKINYVYIDSRSIINYKSTIFISLKSKTRDGHLFIDDLVKKGCENFIVDSLFNVEQFLNCNFLVVENCLDALQEFAVNHRKKFKLNLIGITGSNGKTIVKEWISQFLQDDFNIIKTPQSFNSQIGVPLSILNINETHNLGIFEAGISKVGEMNNLERILKPDIGILTHIGNAHDENFDDVTQKMKEKLLLFSNSKTLLYHSSDIKNKKQLQKINPNINLLSIGNGKEDDFIIDSKKTYIRKQITEVCIYFEDKKHLYSIPFTDTESILNSITCICLMLHFKKSKRLIQNKLSMLTNISMRMEISKGNNKCLLVNDSYSNDVNSFKVAIEFINNRNDYKNKTLIISDFVGCINKKDYDNAIQMVNQLKPYKIVMVGENWFEVKDKLEDKIKFKHFFKCKDDFLTGLQKIEFNNELILFKCSDIYEIEKIINSLKSNIHETILEINLNNLVYNYNYFLETIKKQTKIMIVIKAFAYGSGSIEVAKLLQNKKLDYISVAYLNEALDLRENEISVPIMVMSSNEKDFEYLVKYNIEPEVYSIEFLNKLITYLRINNIYRFPVHLKIDTGMNRLGFKEDDINMLNKILEENKCYLVIKSVFSHLVGSDTKKHNAFSKKQFNILVKVCNLIEKSVQYKFIRHILNTEGILNHTSMQLDMVRLGIGLYGITNNSKIKSKLNNVLTLKTSIAQIKNVNKNETIGYNRLGLLNKKAKVAIIRIGYAEGYPRNLGNGNGKVLINNSLAPTIGNVCMDMTMIDVSKVKNISINDTVIIFGENLPIETIAQNAKTISHAIITGISQRVRREYIYQ